MTTAPRSHPTPSSCPPRHIVYLSQLLADNAVTLHVIGFPQCRGYETFPCGDHWHVAHPSRVIGDACKGDPGHVAAVKRIRRVSYLPGGKRYRRRR